MKRTTAVVVAALAAAAAGPVLGQQKMSAEALAKLAQNPVANLISIPFQNNTNFNVGPRDGTQNVLNIQPVVPFELSKQWNLITRTIVPIITQPGFVAGESTTTGLGDVQFTGFLSPSNAEGLIWGAGAIGQLPTNSSDRLGNDRWGLGPSFVALRLEKGSPWVYGFLVNNVWSVSGGSDPTYNNFLLQPFLNYNLPDGWYLTSSPVVTADWKAESSQRWTVPLGGGVGKIVHFGRLPVNLQLQSYYNVVAPDNGPEWSIRFQIQLMLPKSVL
ncbi:MAG: transporter [Burkholderiales bacterium]